jgi:hypothetical protein
VELRADFSVFTLRICELIVLNKREKSFNYCCMARIYILTTFILVVHTIVDFSCRVETCTGV